MSPRWRCEEDFDNEVDSEFPFDRQCPSCNQVDPPMTVEDNSIGYYEYCGAPGYHESYCFVTECCGAEPVEYVGELEEPDENLIPEDQVA